MNEEWENRLYKLIDEDYDIEDLVGVCKTARRNGFEAGVEWAQKQEQLDLKLAEYINSTELDDKLKLGEYSLVSISSMAIDINSAKTTLSTEFTHNGKRYKAEMLITQKEI